MTDTWTNDLVVVLTRVKDLLLLLLMLSFSGELQQRLNTDSINEAKKKTHFHRSQASLGD